MYRPGREEVVPAPFDEPRPPDEPEEATLLTGERATRPPRAPNALWLLLVAVS